MAQRNFGIAALGLLFALLAGPAMAQSGCGGQTTAGKVCGNSAATQGPAGLVTLTSLLDRAFGATQGTVLNRGALVWTETAAPVLGGGGVGGSLTFSGSSSGAATIRVPAAAGSVIFQLPSDNGTNGYVLSTDGSGGTSWINNVAGGTVQSVGLSMPGIFSVSGSPVTLTGTLTATLATQSANLVWAGPTTGAASAPTFRALVGADLPNPSSSSLGGIQSFVAVGSQWIRQIDTSGVPTASQPAFTDISGTISAAQCVNPSASTLGCIQSLAAVTSKWINTISTSGVPTATQPAFTDISGATTLAQLPSIGNNVVLGNNSGGTAIPSALSASNVLDMIGSTQGQVLYRNASNWTVLAPGTGGQVLTTNGAAANPSWATVAGTGTVTSVATGTGLTGGPITTTGTVSLATITAGTVLANITGGAAVPIANTPTSILDLIGSTQGNILYRGASNWLVLAPGTNGQVLTQGASTPAWGSAGSVSTVSTQAGITGGPITTTGTLSADGNYSGWAVQNCTLAASVSANLLTVALKDNAGSNPSASSPCNVNFRSATATNGTTTLVSQTAALSIATTNTGTAGSLGASNNTAFRFWVVAFNNAGTMVLGLINCSTSTQIFPLDETQVQSTTQFSASATSAGIFYTPNGTTLTGKAFRILGYIEYNSTGLATAGTYASGPNFIQTFGPGVKKPGDVVQTKYYTATAQSTGTGVGIGAATITSLTNTISPTSAANLVWAQYGGTLTASTSAVAASGQMGRNSNANMFGSSVESFSASGGLIASGAAGGGYDKPNTISSTTYSLYIWVNTGTATWLVSGQNPTGSLLLNEVMG